MLEGFPAAPTINDSRRAVIVSISSSVPGSNVLVGCGDEVVDVAEIVVEVADNED